ncbi:uncharacterized protein K452DRAFT_311656 [Aplosporella prunicola CBS 121167]|uniref:MJ1316 RNA cyclic group end recognition domain-containing protein n=1 Tax=Aplosporella prunicola CBS 121167 TaxID=1176127 RepID=A0A6A6B507_9PEZI|nr:uncharacterized protein K452DRAFT_311656 [Aplosporella prunicola CBS 121167]KAF2138294.1 hypothetical protein K452DRAFT_311656 [Aplosporella prunicola CBS 121167]
MHDDILSHYSHFLALTLHTSSPSSATTIPPPYLAWLASCCRLLCDEVQTALPSLHLALHPHPLAPTRSLPNPQTLRFLIGVAPTKPDDEALLAHPDTATRLTCGLQAFLAHVRSSHPVDKGIWLNARYVTRADLPSDGFEKFPLDGNDHATSSSNPLSPASIAALSAALRILPESATPPPRGKAPLPVPPRPDGAATAKLRPAADILDRLRWDAALGGAAAYTVGYHDRFDGIVEISLDAWRTDSTDDDFIPLHRVSYVKRKRDDHIVWWREGRRDELFGSGCGGGGSSSDGDQSA